MIYLCRNKRNGYVKIGFSTTPKYRERTLQSEDPDVFFERIYYGALAEEEQLHKHFAHRRIRGEWFELTPGDLAYIDAQFSHHSVDLEPDDDAVFVDRSAYRLMILTARSVGDWCARDDRSGRALFLRRMRFLYAFASSDDKELTEAEYQKRWDSCFPDDDPDEEFYSDISWGYHSPASECDDPSCECRIMLTDGEGI